MGRKKKNKDLPENVAATEKIIVKEPDIKDKAVSLLCEKGYKAWLKDGVVLVLRESETTFEDITVILKESGYNSSYGVTNNISYSITSQLL